jgi:capsular polysaccharide biosynthesis protein
MHRYPDTINFDSAVTSGEANLLVGDVFPFHYSDAIEETQIIEIRNEKQSQRKPFPLRDEHTDYFDECFVKTCIYAVEDATCYNGSQVVLSRNGTRLIQASVDHICRPTNLMQELNNNSISRLISLSSRLIHIKGGTLILEGTWAREYYHFVSETLSKIFIFVLHSKGARIDNILIPNAAHRSFIMEWLDILGLTQYNIIESDSNSLFSFELAYFPTFSAPPGKISNNFYNWICNLPQVKSICTANSLGTLYVGRRNYRNIVNEDEVLKVLGRYGIEIIYPEEHSVTEQIKLFSKARVFIGPHGGGLTNCLFSKKGLSILELFPSFHTNPCYLQLASLLNGKHYSYIASNFDTFYVPSCIVEKVAELALNECATPAYTND